MRINVACGRTKIIVPVGSDQTVAWLAAEVGRRLARLISDTDTGLPLNESQTQKNEERNLVDQCSSMEQTVGETRESTSHSLLTHSNSSKCRRSCSRDIVKCRKSPKQSAEATSDSMHAHAQSYPFLTQVRTVPVRELRTVNNAVLDPEDQLIDVVHDNDLLIAVIGDSINDEVSAGDVIEQYQLLELIGEGTFGCVFKAKDLNLNRMVAVKILRKDKSSEVSTRRFLREAELNGKLMSPYICTVFDFGRSRSGTLYLVMELLRGKPLAELIYEHIDKNQSFTALECIHLVRPALKGLQVAHNSKPAIIHRDIKPDNLFVLEEALQLLNKPLLPNKDKSANFSNSSSCARNSSCTSHTLEQVEYACKVLDFGLAIPSEMWRNTLAAGTRMYSSPEQVRRNYKLDNRTDIYSIGVVLYQMVTLLDDMPFDPVEINMGKSVPHIKLYMRTQISEHFQHIIMTALAKEPENRFQTVEEMIAAMDKEENAIINNFTVPVSSEIDVSLTSEKENKNDDSRKQSCRCTCGKCGCQKIRKRNITRPRSRFFSRL